MVSDEFVYIYTMKTNCTIGSLLNVRDINESVGIIKRGGIVIAQLGGVFGMFADGQNRDALDTILTAKQISDKNRPFSTMMFYKDIIKYVDLSLVHRELYKTLSNGQDLAKLIGTLIHLRLPLRHDLVHEIPTSMRNLSDDVWIIHSLDPSGRPIENFIRQLNVNGIKFVAVTTLNKHGEPEITTWEEAIEFSSAFIRFPHAEPIHLKDPTYKRKSVKGSLTIVDTMYKSIVREGFVPTELVEAIFGVTFSKDAVKHVKHNQSQGLHALISLVEKQHIEPEFVRDLILNYISGNVRVRHSTLH
jgi:tRNA A37 threonylcarbamoyladenosine synthetase subunit TsaC/SUA5/YrdC